MTFATCGKPIRALQEALGGDLRTVEIAGMTVKVIGARMTRWRGPTPSSEFQHWNKGYWLDDGGEPGFAETAIAHLLDRAGWSGRWASSSFGELRFRVDARQRESDVLAAQSPPAHVVRLLDELARRVIVLAVEADLSGVRGGCWDVVAWRPKSPLLFVEAKQKGETWADALRVSQRLWVEAASQVPEPCCFAVVDWSF